MNFIVVIEIVSFFREENFDIHQFLANEKDTNDDLLLAQMLQHEFDKEHDTMLMKEEQKFNGTSSGKQRFSSM